MRDTWMCVGIYLLLKVVWGTYMDLISDFFASVAWGVGPGILVFVWNFGNHDFCTRNIQKCNETCNERRGRSYLIISWCCDSKKIASISLDMVGWQISYKNSWTYRTGQGRRFRNNSRRRKKLPYKLIIGHRTIFSIFIGSESDQVATLVTN